MDVPVLADQQEVIYISSVQTQDLIWKTYWERWMIVTEEERERERERESQDNSRCQFDLMMMMMYFSEGY